jgi:hypothetical protein
MCLLWKLSRLQAEKTCRKMVLQQKQQQQQQLKLRFQPQICDLRNQVFFKIHQLWAANQLLVWFAPHVVEEP